jgi:hypothetical protein
MSDFLLKNILAEALGWKDIPEEERQAATELINQHNDYPAIDKEIKGHYAIDVTGKHQVYYTFWRFKEIDPRFAAFIKNPIYMGNLTTDFLTSVNKALERMPATTKLTIYADESRQHLIGKTEVFTFGQYRGEPYYEVFQKNPSYFAWLAQKQDPKYANTKSAAAIRVFAEMYYEEATKKNLATSTSQFVGVEGDKYEGELTVYSMKDKQGTDFHTGQPNTYKSFKLTDASGNKFLAVDLQKYFPNVKEKDVIRVNGRIKAHREILGVKFTALNYVKAA